MEVSTWVESHWFDVVQTLGIVVTFLFSAYVTSRDARARRVANSIAITDQYHQIWRDVYSHPELSRVISESPDLLSKPVSFNEELFVTTLIAHLSTVYRAMKQDEFVDLQGLARDVKQFFSLPIPKAVWEKIRAFQDDEFVGFIKRSEMIS
jgi:hypothetical protein